MLQLWAGQSYETFISVCNNKFISLFTKKNDVPIFCKNLNLFKPDKEELLSKIRTKELKKS